MAKRQQQQNGQQLVVIFMTIWLVVVSSLMKLDSVSASSISVNGNGNLLQQHQQQLQHVVDNEEEHNYVMDQNQQKTTTTQPSSTEVLGDDDDDDVDDNDSMKSNSVSADLTRSQLIFGHPFQPLKMVKRAPGGFVGMRGKKAFSETEEQEDSDNVNSMTFPWEQIQNSDEYINWDDNAKPNGRRYKKAPTAFYGVRGKKFATVNGANPSNGWQDFLQKLEEDRVRDAMLQNFIERLGEPTDLQGEMAKRAPIGFTGMRGKRPSLDDVESMTKRGLGNNAFVGVRGKKDVSHQTFKRSPKSESSAGGDGKRQRFADFGNKFVAVRGKKSSYDLIDNMATLYSNNRSPSSANGQLLYANSGKRTPSGFLGMRGKRPFTTDEI